MTVCCDAWSRWGQQNVSRALLAGWVAAGQWGGRSCRSVAIAVQPRAIVQRSATRPRNACLDVEEEGGAVGVAPGDACKSCR